MKMFDRQLFELGQIVATPGSLAAMEDAGPDVMIELLRRHATGDWGTLPPEDADMNDHAVKHGDSRIMSAYRLVTGERIWIITEWDRSVTTFLLPDEY